MGTSCSKSPCLFEGSGEEHGDGSVEEGNAPTNFAGEGVEVKGGCTAFPASMNATFAWPQSGDWVAKTKSSGTLEF